jgi:membrane protein
MDAGPREDSALLERRKPSAEEGRGRSSDTTGEPPARGWKDIGLRLYGSITDDRILANAASVAFYGLLALFPAIAALVSVYGLFADPAAIQQHLADLAGVFPGGAIDVVGDQLKRLTAQPPHALGLGFAVGLLVSLWSANGGIKALFDALNVVYGEKEERGFFHLNAVSLAFTLTVIAFLILALSAIIAVPVALDYLPEFLGGILALARWPVLLLIVAVALAAMYRWGPSRSEPRWRWVSWGSAAAAIAWLALSALFSWYAANFGNFNKTYGSLGAVIGLMLWMWLSVIVILVGGKLNAEMEHQTARQGPPR